MKIALLAALVISAGVFTPDMARADSGLPPAGVSEGGVSAEAWCGPFRCYRRGPGWRRPGWRRPGWRRPGWRRGWHIESQQTQSPDMPENMQ